MKKLLLAGKELHIPGRHGSLEVTDSPLSRGRVNQGAFGRPFTFRSGMPILRACAWKSLFAYRGLLNRRAPIPERTPS